MMGNGTGIELRFRLNFPGACSEVANGRRESIILPTT